VYLLFHGCVPFVSTNGATHDLFDRVRRWFAFLFCVECVKFRMLFFFFCVLWMDGDAVLCICSFICSFANMQKG